MAPWGRWMTGGTLALGLLAAACGMSHRALAIDGVHVSVENRDGCPIEIGSAWMTRLEDQTSGDGTVVSSDVEGDISFTNRASRQVEQAQFQWHCYTRDRNFVTIIVLEDNRRTDAGERSDRSWEHRIQGGPVKKASVRVSFVLLVDGTTWGKYRRDEPGLGMEVVEAR